MSNRELPMMPWFPKEFAAATSTWSFAERSAYRALLDVQWEMGVLPTESWRLAQGIGMALDAFEEVWPVVRHKFHVVGGGIRNERLEEHRVKAFKLTQGRKKGAYTTNAKRTAYRGADRHAERNANRSAERDAERAHPSSSPSPSEEEHPQPPQGGWDGADARSRKGPERVKRDASREAWATATLPIDHVRETARLPAELRLTWAYVQQQVDPIAWEAIQQVGGCMAIAERDRYTEEQLKQRFREAYEQRLRQEQHA